MSLSPSPLSLWRYWLLLLVVFLLMGCGMAYELLIAAYASAQHGDSIYQFSLTVGLFMSAMGLGSYLTQHIEEGLLEWLAGIQLLLALLGGGTVLLLGFASLYTSSFLTLSHLWTVLLGTLVGVQLPLSIRWMESVWPVEKLLARVMLLDYLGALAGSLLFTWWFLPRLGFVKTSLALAAIALFGLLLIVLSFGPELRRKSAFLCAAASLLGLLLLGWWQGEAWLEAHKAKLVPGVRKVYLTRSPYQEIRFVKYSRSYFLTLNRHMQFSSQDERRYHEALVHPPLSLATSRKRVLLLGGGDGLVMRELWRYHDVEEVVMVDLDPAMTNFGRFHPVMRKLNEDSMHKLVQTRHYCLTQAVCPQRAPRLLFQKRVASSRATCPLAPARFRAPTGCKLVTTRKQTRQKLTIVNRDAWKLVAETPRPFPVILSDLPDATVIALSKLYSVEFYRMLKQKLSPGGVIALQSTTVSPSLRRGFWCIVNTMRTAGFKALGYHAWVPSFGQHTSFTLAGHTLPRPGDVRLTVPTTFLSTSMLPRLFWFPKDLREIPTQPNRIDTHVLLRYMLR